MASQCLQWTSSFFSLQWSHDKLCPDFFMFTFDIYCNHDGSLQAAEHFLFLWLLKLVKFRPLLVRLPQSELLALLQESRYATQHNTTQHDLYVILNVRLTDRKKFIWSTKFLTISYQSLINDAHPWKGKWSMFLSLIFEMRAIVCFGHLSSNLAGVLMIQQRAVFTSGLHN